MGRGWENFELQNGGKILDFPGRNGNFRNDLVTEEEDPGAVARPLMQHPAPRDRRISVSSSLAWYAQQTQASKGEIVSPCQKQ